MNHPRRAFLKSAAAAAAGAPAVLGRKSPNDTIGIACLGVGTRGIYLMEQAQGVPKTEIRVISDLYEGHRRRAREACANKEVRITNDWEDAIQSSDVDAVLIATPDFWHAPMTIRGAQLKKDLYVEKGWCRTLEEAKKMRSAIKQNNVVMQCGHNYNSLPTFHKARQIYRSGQLGKVPVIRTYIDRTGPYPEWKFYGAYNVNEMPADAAPETIDWNRFIANAPKRPFDAERFFTWRKWWDYSSGIAGDLMSHLWDSVNMVAGMGIPESAVTQGGLYFWKDGRDVPDMWHVVFDYPRKELAVTFACTFNNRHVGEVAQYLGRDATLEVSPAFCRTWMAEWKPEFREKLKAGPIEPEYSYKRGELQVSSHMEDFLDCVRTRNKTRCDVDQAFEEAATLVMSVEAYRRERKVKWDSVNEKVV
jgi:predicted dehydrogenase